MVKNEVKRGLKDSNLLSSIAKKKARSEDLAFFIGVYRVSNY
jgi:hypothetical protein